MNIMIISGNLGKDIEVRYTQSGKAIGSFPLPVKQGYGEHEKTSWVDVKILGDRAEKVRQFLTKGKEVTVSGEFVYEQWEKEGVKHGKPVLIMQSIDFHGGKQDSGQSSQGAKAGQGSQPAQSGGGYDDDLPF